MSTGRRALLVLLALALLGFAAPRALVETGDQARLAGLWEARKDFGPDVRGTLTLTRDGDRWEASIAGLRAEGRVAGGRLELRLPDDQGSYRGPVPDPELPGSIVGHWVQPAMASNGTPYATPVRLEPAGKATWRGEVQPLADRMTFFLALEKRDDGSLGGVLNNPEANAGRWLAFDRVLVEGTDVRFLRDPDSQVVMRGELRETGVLSILLPPLDGAVEFRRAADEAGSPFHARPPGDPPYAYRPPLAAGDGWEVASLADVDMAREPIEELVQELARASLTDPSTPSVHALLVARHGKLVVEEYFHGYTANDPHDTRSAGKSLVSTVIGAALEAGAPLELSSGLVDVLGKDEPVDTDDRKARITLEHLLTMTSGLACDDSNPSSPGNEETMQSQDAQPDWLRYALALPMEHEPGEVAAYCSASPHLAAGMLSAATGEWLPDLLQDLVAGPLGIERYHMNLAPNGAGYGGGGIHLRGRDFLALGQLLLDGGIWKGRRILSEGWAADAVAPIVPLWQEEYGYLWWVIDYPYRDGRVQAFYAGGNGGQYAIGIPELELAVVFFAGDYGAGVVAQRAKREYVPRFILRAIEEGASGGR